MNEKFNKNAKVGQLTKVVLSHGEEKGLIVKDPLKIAQYLFPLTVLDVMFFSIVVLKASRNSFHI